MAYMQAFIESPEVVRGYVSHCPNTANSKILASFPDHLGMRPAINGLFLISTTIDA